MANKVTFFDMVKGYASADFLARATDFLGSGVVHPTTDFALTFPATPNMTINVGAGTAWANGYRMYFDGVTTYGTLTVNAANATLPRIDLIEIGPTGSQASGTLAIKFVVGTPAASPVQPSADSGYVPLYAVYVGAGVTSISAANITNLRAAITIQNLNLNLNALLVNASNNEVTLPGAMHQPGAISITSSSGVLTLTSGGNIFTASGTENLTSIVWDGSGIVTITWNSSRVLVNSSNLVLTLNGANRQTNVGDIGIYEIVDNNGIFTVTELSYTYFAGNLGVNDSFRMGLPYYYQRNTKQIAFCTAAESWANNSWAGTAGTVGNDSVNFRVNGQAISCTGTVNGGGVNLAKTMDLTSFNDGSSSSASGASSDFIDLIVYITTANIGYLNSSGGLTVRFLCDASGTVTNYFSYNIAKANLSNGFNFIKVQKSGFTTNGSAAWNSIKGIDIIFNGAPSQSCTFTIDHWQLVRKDASIIAPNPLQREINATWTDDFTLDAISQFSVFMEYGAITIRDLNSAGANTGYGATAGSMVSNAIFSGDFDLFARVIVNNSTGLGWWGWQVDNQDRVRISNSGGGFQFYSDIAGVSTSLGSVAYTANVGDVIDIKLGKKGQSFTAEFIVNDNINNPYLIAADIPTLAANTGRLMIGERQGLTFGENVLQFGYSKIKAAEAQHAIIADKAYLADYLKNRPNRNAIINGAHNIQQRAASQLAVTSTGVFICDRWEHKITGSSDTASQQSFTPGQGVVPYEPQYWLRDIVTTSAGSGNFVNRSQKIENVRTFAGQQVTLSFWAKADAARNMAIEFVQCFGTSNFGSTSGISTNVTGIGSQLIPLTTNWQLYTVTVTIPSIAGKTVGSDLNSSYLQLNFWFDAGSSFNSRTANLGQQSGTFDITLIQTEPGPNYTGFELRSYAQELILCQEFCWSNGGAQTTLIAAGGAAESTTVAILVMNLPVFMRCTGTNPILSWSTIALSSNSGAVFTITGLSIIGFTPNAILLQATVASGLTAGYYYYIQSASPGYLIIDSEIY